MLTLQWFLQIPRSRVILKPNYSLMARNGCSTFTMMWALAASTKSSTLQSGLSAKTRLFPGLNSPGMLCSCQTVLLASQFLDIRSLRRPPPNPHGEARLLGNVMNIGRGGFYRVDQAGVLVHADMYFHSKVPLVAFLGLVHL